MCWPVLRITVVVLLTCRGLSHVRVQLYIMIGACGLRGGIRHRHHHPLADSCAVHGYVYIILPLTHSVRWLPSSVVFVEFRISSTLYLNYNNIIIQTRMWVQRQHTAHSTYRVVRCILYHDYYYDFNFFFPSHPALPPPSYYSFPTSKRCTAKFVTCSKKLTRFMHVVRTRV